MILMIEYKSEIWNSDTHKYDVIEGSNLKGLYAYLLQNIELTLNKPTASIDDISSLLTTLADSVADSDTHYDDKLAQAQDELKLCLNSYDNYYYDDENKQMVNQVVLKQLKETTSLLVPEELDTVFRDLAGYCKEQTDSRYFKYQNMENHIKTLYTIKINKRGKTSTDIHECYNYLIDHLDQLDHSKIHHSVYSLLAAIDDYLFDHLSCNTAFVTATRKKITMRLACHKADGTTLVNPTIKRYLKQLGNSFSDSALDLIIVNFKNNTMNKFCYSTSSYVESDKR